MKVVVFINLMFFLLLTFSCTGDSKQLSNPDRKSGFDEGSFDVECEDRILGTQFSDEFFYGNRPPSQEEMDLIAPCKKAFQIDGVQTMIPLLNNSESRLHDGQFIDTYTPNVFLNYDLSI